MISHEERVSLLELLFREKGMGSLFFFTLPAVQSSHGQELAASYLNPEPEPFYSI